LYLTNLSMKGTASSHLPPAASPRPRIAGYHHRQKGSALRIFSVKATASSGLPAKIKLMAIKALLLYSLGPRAIAFIP